MIQSGIVAGFVLFSETFLRWNALAVHSDAAMKGISVMLTVWAATRFYKQWEWQPSRLDLALPAWGVSIGASTLTNLRPEVFVGGGFMLIYAALYYMWHDLASNKIIKPSHVANGLLLAGLAQAPAMLNQLITQKPLVGMFENANYLGMFLAILLPLTLQRRFKPYTLALIGGIALTGSRGAILAVGVASAAHYWGMLKRKRWVLIAAALPALYIFATRGLTGREVYWKDALSNLSVLGHGLLSYRHPDFIDLNRIHWHAHSLPINLLYELGAPGAVAFALSAWRFRNILKDKQLGGSLLALGAGQIFDFTLQLPALSAIGVLLLANRGDECSNL